MVILCLEFFWEVLRISSLNSSSNTGTVYVLKLLLENITLLERQQFLPSVYICLSSRGGKIKNLKENIKQLGRFWCLPPLG